MENLAGRENVDDVGSGRGAQVLTALTVWIASMIVLRPTNSDMVKVVAIAAVAAAVQIAVSQRASHSQFAGTRVFEASQIWVGALSAGLVALVLGLTSTVGVSVPALVAGFLGSGLALGVVHECTARRTATHRKRAVIIGTGEEAVELIALAEQHPEIGFDVVGCIGNGDYARTMGLAEEWLGPIEDLEVLLESESIDLPIVAVTSFRHAALQSVVQRLHEANHDVAMSWGVGRISNNRMATRTFSHEAFPVIRASRRSGSGLIVKRFLDVTAAVLLLALSAPILAVAMLVIRRDSGPAFFRQERVGLNGKTFEIIKLRTMRVNAHDELKDLAENNERSGPLFKMTSDPRVTRFGRILRSTSIDEIPQLINVLRGEMSLVGPRPALVEECKSFDQELMARSSVLPGITGLWQLEARGNASFEAYKRLDLHYLENWSLGLDLRIIVATAQVLVLGPLVAPLVKLFSRYQPAEVTEATSDAVAFPTAAELAPERIAILGAGYVGLTQALGMVSLGHEVVCADIDPNRVAELQAGIPPILEEGLEQLLAESNASGRLTFTAEPEAAVTDVDFVFLCVATPQGASGEADLTYLKTAARQIGPVLKPGTVVINKSTVPVGSTDIVAGELERADTPVVSNPEFLREGTAIADWQAPDRIVVGGDADAARRVMDLYEDLPGTRVVCDAASAELIKYASNAYLATRLTFVNSLTSVSDALGADAGQVTTAMGLDERIGPRYLQPGPGWGGSCLPKDTHALAYQADEAGVGFTQLRATIGANDAHLDRAARMILNAGPIGPEPLTVAALGLAFKAGTGDTRESPAIKIIERLLAAGVEVRAYDPGVINPPIDGLISANSGVDAARGADVVAVLTEWPEFKDLDFEKVAEVMRSNRVVDLRNLLDHGTLAAHGLDYQTIGRPTPSPVR